MVYTPARFIVPPTAKLYTFDRSKLNKAYSTKRTLLKNSSNREKLLRLYIWPMWKRNAHVRQYCMLIKP